MNQIIPCRFRQLNFYMCLLNAPPPSRTGEIDASPRIPRDAHPPSPDPATTGPVKPTRRASPRPSRPPDRLDRHDFSFRTHDGDIVLFACARGRTSKNNPFFEHRGARRSRRSDLTPRGNELYGKVRQGTTSEERAVVGLSSKRELTSGVATCHTSTEGTRALLGLCGALCPLQCMYSNSGYSVPVHATTTTSVSILL